MHKPNEYKGLPTLLHRVRWTQHLFSIIAELLMLLAFLGSGMDANVGGLLAGVGAYQWLWAAMFALGLDTAFIIAWVRCKQVGLSWHLTWCIPVALGISAIVLPPVVIQLLQSTLHIGFTQAVEMLGINIVQLAWGRALVSVVLGAVLALTNVESAMQSNTSNTVRTGRRRLKLFDDLLDKYAPVIDNPPPASETAQASNVQAPGKKNERPALKVVQNKGERIKQAIIEQPGLSNRAIANRLGVAPSTVGVYRKEIETAQASNEQAV